MNRRRKAAPATPGSDPRKPAGRGETSQAPKVGIFFLVNGRLWFECTPLSEAGNYGDFKIHEGDHIRFWDDLVRAGSVPADSEYEDYPRGRVVCNAQTGHWVVYMDRCISRRQELVRQIITEMQLAEPQLSTDEHYRCACCLREEADPL